MPTASHAASHAAPSHAAPSPVSTAPTACRMACLALAAFLHIAPGADAQPTGILDLATADPDAGTLTRVYGASGIGVFGIPVAGGHDVDGDGLADVAVAFMTVDSLGRTDAGEVDLVFGDGQVGGTFDTALDDPRLLRFFGAGDRETAGSEIWIDDVTGDGLADLLICRQNFTPPVPAQGPARIGAGALSIVPGGPGLRTLAAALAGSGGGVDLRAPPAELGITTLVGEESLDRLGIWARTGDVDGDGIHDLVVGADQADALSQRDRGMIYVVRGGPHLVGRGHLDLAAPGTLVGHVARIVPPLDDAEDWHFGATNQIADLDGDGRAEVLAAATINRSGATLRANGAPAGSAVSSSGVEDGAFFIAWGENFRARVWPKRWTFPIDAAPGGSTSFHGAPETISFGEELLGGLDYDGDGNADLFVGDLAGDGSPAGNRRLSGIGWIFFDAAGLRGRDLDLDDLPGDVRMTRILGPTPGAIGADTAAHGDFDGDGLADLVIAAPEGQPQDRVDAGIVHVLFGQITPWPAEIDLAPGSLPAPEELRIVEIHGANGTNISGDTGDTLGYSATAGDLDGDGLPELIINEMVGNGALPSAEDVGNLIVISGAALAGLAQP